MKKRIYYFYIILIFPISFINQERIAFAETVNTPTNEYLNQKKDKRYIEAKDSEIYAGDLWNPKDNFVSATDEAGNPIYWGNSKIAVNTYDFDPNTAGLYDIIYYFSYTDISSRAYIRVKSSIEAKDSEKYVGDRWDPKENFVSATDEDGNPVYWGDSRITCTDTVDVSKPSINEIEYRITRNGNVIRSKAKVRVKEDQTKVKLKDTELHVGQKWDLGSVFKNVVDKDGNPIKPEKVNYVWIDGNKTREIDTSKSGKHTVKIAVENAKGDLVYSNEVTVTVEDKTSIKTKNSTIYAGQGWSKIDNFVSATDEVGQNVPFQDKRIRMEGATDVEPIKPAVYKVTYIFDEKFKQVKSESTVTVKEDKTKAELKDTELYVGQKWDLGSVFKNVVDKDGNPIKPEKVNYVWIDGNKTREIDTSKPGKHTVKIAILKANDEGVYSNEVTVKVKEDKTKAELKDTELYVGQKWGLGSVFKYAIDKDGNPIKLEQVPWVDIDGKQIDLRENKTKELIDTNKPGTHKVSIAIRNAADVGHAYEWAHSNVVTVTVKEEPFTIKQVPYFDFEDHILVSTNKSVVNKKEEPIIEVETPSINGKDWHLQVELSPFLDKENSKSILKGVSLFIPKGKLESDSETEEPTQYDCQLEANGKASILMHGTKTKGKGRWKNKLATKGITLSIPPENKKGNYESTLHWTLLDVPG
ncbi:bacterial Ig-like domain-containing protein [Enterococcus faecalis]|uniref:bacterial Ig-like domain-containing protein n=1 Tax=Enterococcus faecalis TaxID=1351 RepID=UPI001D187C8E|nr:bacterial Ig-like domain-containing protein [Enterococcus faecalis]MCC4124058.1 bacterial Ig-like domain-containing protein [Enterococcus faecalis]